MNSSTRVPLGLISVTRRSGSKVWSIVRVTFTSVMSPARPPTVSSEVVELTSGMGLGTSVELMVALPVSRVPLSFRSWKTVHPDSPGSVASSTPLWFRSSNTVPEIEPGTATALT